MEILSTHSIFMKFLLICLLWPSTKHNLLIAACFRFCSKYAVPNKLPSKQVSVLMHRKRRLREEASHNHVKKLNRGFKLRRKGRGYKKPEHFIREFRLAERDQRRMQRSLNQRRLTSTVLDDVKILAVMRHRAHKVCNKEITVILQSLGLGRLHNTVLLKNDKGTNTLLKLVEPYVTYGYPSIQTVRDLIFKHGYLSIDGKKTPINSNQLIEEHLGSLGVLCIEDIVHELFTVSDNFKAIRSKLLPFLVSTKYKQNSIRNDKTIFFSFAVETTTRRLVDKDWRQL